MQKKEREGKLDWGENIYFAGILKIFWKQTGVFIQKNKVHNFLFELDANTKEILLEQIKVQISFDVWGRVY